VRFQDGSIQRFATNGSALPFSLRVDDGDPVQATAIAPDRAGGLYVAEPAKRRVLHVSADGRLLQQIRFDRQALDEVRSLETSMDGAHVYALSGTALWELDVPGQPATR
jgi:hypothetical protein